MINRVSSKKNLKVTDRIPGNNLEDLGDLRITNGIYMPLFLSLLGYLQSSHISTCMASYAS